MTMSSFVLAALLSLLACAAVAQAAGDAPACLPLTAIRLVGVHVLPRGEVEAARGGEMSCPTREAINGFLRRLGERYLRHGLVAVRIVPEPVAADGTLTIRVDEGRVARLEAPAARGDVDTLFPDMVGRPFDLRALEQGLDQANRLPGISMNARVVPADGGGVDVVLDERAGTPWHGFLALDNAGTPQTGILQATVSVGIDNPGGVYDAAGITLEQTPGRDAGHRRRALSLYYSRPYGYWTLNLGAGWSDYLNRQRLVYHTVALSGETTSASARLERVLRRDAARIDSIYLQLSHRRVRHYFMDAVRDLASPTLTVAGVGVGQRRFLPRGTLYLRFGLEHGLPVLGARQPAAAGDGAPVVRFDKWVLGLDADLRLGACLWQSRFGWQGSRQPLPATEQMELTSPGAVRGHARNALAGETAWYWRNTCQGRVATTWGTVLPRVGLDTGRALRRGERPPWRGLSGASVGAGLQRGALGMDLEYSRPLGRPAGFVAEGHRLLAGAAWSY
jgi:hemolysin activation/secretion protein